MGFRELSKNPENKSEVELDTALDRISIADEADVQVDREIWRYWNDRVSKELLDKQPLRRLRSTIISTLSEAPKNDHDTSDDDAYQNGLAAHKINHPKQSNPYQYGSSMYDSWEMGWQQGFDESFDEEIN